MSPVTNVVNHRELAAHSIGSVDPPALLRGGACIKLKPDIYDGSESLREFFAQFNLIVRVNHWEDETKIAVLISCLRGKACAIFREACKI